LLPTVPATETKILAGNGYGWVDGWISEGGNCLVRGESEQCENGGTWDTFE
jgi:hypothetical protein